MTLLEAVKGWAQERGVGYVSRWLKKRKLWETVLHLGDIGNVTVEVNEAGTRAVVRAAGGRLFHAKTARGVQQALSSLLLARGARECKSPRHTNDGCPACGLVRRGGGRTSKVVRIPTLRVREPLPPDEVQLPPALRVPQTVEEAEVELERLMRVDAPPEALRAAGARLDALLEKRPLN